MQTLYLVPSDYTTPLELHLALKRMLHLPNHYGCNADALADCLSPSHPVRLWIAGAANEALTSALQKCALAVHDAGGDVRYL